MARVLACYRGEFRYVFYSDPGKYEKTVAFYTDTLGFPVVGGFPGGTYVRASTGVIEVIDADVDEDGLWGMVLRGHGRYSPPQGASSHRGGGRGRPSCSSHLTRCHSFPGCA
jgi:catechol 2,3-dioxygenase-like lactoylglutathione lyase family enzyme